MDFFIVMASIFDMALSGYDLAALKILRMLRVFRPSFAPCLVLSFSCLLWVLVSSVAFFAAVGCVCFLGSFPVQSYSRYLEWCEWLNGIRLMIWHVRLAQLGRTLPFPSQTLGANLHVLAKEESNLFKLHLLLFIFLVF